MILGQTRSALWAVTWPARAAVFSRLDGVKNRKGSAGVEHRKEPCPSGCVKKPGACPKRHARGFINDLREARGLEGVKKSGTVTSGVLEARMGTGNQANLVRATKTAGFFPVGPPNVEPSWVPVPVPTDSSGRGPAAWARFPARSHFTVRGSPVARIEAGGIPLPSTAIGAPPARSAAVDCDLSLPVVQPPTSLPSRKTEAASRGAWLGSRFAETCGR